MWYAYLPPISERVFIRKHNTVQSPCMVNVIKWYLKVHNWPPRKEHCV